MSGASQKPLHVLGVLRTPWAGEPGGGWATLLLSFDKMGVVWLLIQKLRISRWQQQSAKAQQVSLWGQGLWDYRDPGVGTVGPPGGYLCGSCVEPGSGGGTSSLGIPAPSKRIPVFFHPHQSRLQTPLAICPISVTWDEVFHSLEPWCLT